MDALKSGVQGGILTPNEARLQEHLSAKPGGDDLFLQQQMMPVNVGRDEKQPDTVPPTEAEEPLYSAKLAGALQRRVAAIRAQAKAPARLGHTRALLPR